MWLECQPGISKINAHSGPSTSPRIEFTNKTLLYFFKVLWLVRFVSSSFSFRIIIIITIIIIIINLNVKQMKRIQVQFGFFFSGLPGGILSLTYTQGIWPSLRSSDPHTVLDGNSINASCFLVFECSPSLCHWQESPNKFDNIPSLIMMVLPAASLNAVAHSEGTGMNGRNSVMKLSQMQHTYKKHSCPSWG